MWTFESNGTGKDGKGHTCGAGLAKLLQTVKALGESDALMSETYYAQDNSFLPLANGAVLNWDGTHAHADQAAWVVATLWQQLQAAKDTKPAPTVDPLAQKALDVLTGLKAMLGEL